MRTICLLCGLAVAASGLAQTEVTPYIPGKSTEAVTYFLPKTVIEIEVQADKATYTPGEFSKYADRYLRLNGIATEESTQWEISSITVKPAGMPDPAKVFSVKLKDKTAAPLVGLTPDGIITSINLPYEKKEKEKPAAEPKPARKIDPHDLMTEEMLMAGSTAKMAELAAREIYDIRESKNAILRGQADNMPKDGEAMKLMLSNLEEQENAWLELFCGTTTHESRTFTVRLVPNKNLEKEVLFRFSKHLGVLDNDDLGGEPVYVTLTNLNTVPQASGEDAGKKKLEGIVYNVPGKAKLTIFNRYKTFFDNTVLATQFGNTEMLAKDLFNKKTTTQVIFDPVSGAILKIQREGE